MRARATAILILSLLGGPTVAVRTMRCSVVVIRGEDHGYYVTVPLLPGPDHS